METTGKTISEERIKTAIKAHGQQKTLAIELQMSDSNLSKFIDEQLPLFCRLLDVVGLEVVQKGHVADLRRVLKEVL